jgi:hypothetical protein
MLSYPYIYEYDLKGAFPSLDIRFVYDELIRLGNPEPIARFLCAMAIDTVDKRSPFGDLLPEPKIEAQEQFRDHGPSINMLSKGAYMDVMMMGLGLPMDYAEEMAYGLPEEVVPLPQEVQGAMKSTLPSIGMPRHALEMCYSGTDWRLPGMLTYEVAQQYGVDTSLTRSTVLYRTERFNPHSIHLKGFPQGGGISPVIWNLVFASAVERSAFAIPGAIIKAYADDFLVFSKKPLLDRFPVTEAFIAAGLQYAEAKSRPIKLAGN